MASSILLCFDFIGDLSGFCLFFIFKKNPEKSQTVKLVIPLQVFTEFYVALL